MGYSETSIQKKAGEDEKANRELIKTLKKKPPRDLDEVVHDAHNNVFEKIDCLSCSNCCRSLGPRIIEKDIGRISKYSKMKSSAFIQTYLRVDEDGDYVFKQMPCPFLEADNSCRIYENRPKACREYPHTNRKKFYQILDLTFKNSYVCPAVIEILGNLRVWKGLE
jgi:Fe-S-cluster containining protein